VGHVPYHFVQSDAALNAVLFSLETSAKVSLAIETTGLDPRSDRIRLLSLLPQDGRPPDGKASAWLVDCFSVDPSPLFSSLPDKELVIPTPASDLSFLAHRWFTPAAPVHDTLLLSRLLTAGGPDWHKNGLAECALRELNITLDKSHQKANWSGDLS